MRHIETNIANELDLLAQSLIKNKQQSAQLKSEKEELENRVRELLSEGERYLTDSEIIGKSNSRKVGECYAI